MELNSGTNVHLYKSEYKLHEVCSLTGVRPYILRFWETEFPEISPVLLAQGYKVYSKNDVEVILQIKKLLWTEKLSLERAKMRMRNEHLVKDESIVKLEVAEELVLEAAVAPKEIREVVKGLSDSEKQKLILAKAKLQSLISHAQSIRNNSFGN